MENDRTASQTTTNGVQVAGVLPTAMPPKPKPSDGDRVDIKEPRYALAALETLYRKCHQRPDSYPVTEVDVWHFAKFPKCGRLTPSQSGLRLELQASRARRLPCAATLHLGGAHSGELNWWD